MRKKFLLLILFLISISYSNAQEEATITLHDGTIVEGFVKVRRYYKIKFWETLEGKPNDDYNEWNVKELKVYNTHTEEYDIYEYKKDVYNNIVLLKQYIIGNVSIYYKNVTVAGSYDSNGFLTSPVGQVDVYYISKSSNNNVLYMRKFNPKKKSFARAYATYIGDCPMILEKLKNKEFDKWTDVIKEYNTTCPN